MYVEHTCARSVVLCLMIGVPPADGFVIAFAEAVLYVYTAKHCGLSRLQGYHLLAAALFAPALLLAPPLLALALGVALAAMVVLEVVRLAQLPVIGAAAPPAVMFSEYLGTCTLTVLPSLQRWFWRSCAWRSCQS